MFKECQHVPRSEPIIIPRRKLTPSIRFETRTEDDDNNEAKKKESKDTTKKSLMEMLASTSSRSSSNTVGTQLTVKDVFTKDSESIKEHFELKLKMGLKKVRNKPGAVAEFHRGNVYSIR